MIKSWHHAAVTKLHISKHIYAVKDSHTTVVRLCRIYYISQHLKCHRKDENNNNTIN